MLTLSEINAADVVMQDAKRVSTSPFRDMRGAFDVVWESADFSAAGLRFQPMSCAVSYNEKAGTLRGMHYQKPPHGQAKLVCCTRGRVWDVIADLRPDSASYLSWAATELGEASGQAIYIPSGYAHGFVTLTDHATVSYLIEGTYTPDAAGTVRWNDPALSIDWPVPEPIMAQRDRTPPDFRP
jgi:dTDP-4-dehydrorhamnose 3,5-epimerase